MFALNAEFLQLGGMLVAATAFVVGIRSKLGQVVTALEDFHEAIKELNQRVTKVEIELARWQFKIGGTPHDRPDPSDA